MLIVWGAKDPAFGPAQLERWKAGVPHADIVELPVGHWPHEEAPADVIAAMRHFVG